MQKDRRPDEDAEKKICRLYRSDFHMKAIALQVDTSLYHVQQCLRRHEISARTRTETNYLRTSLDVGRLRQLLDEAVLNMNQMAAELGVSVPTIVRRMRKLGWKSKKGRGSPMEKNYFWKGGRARDDDGYVLIMSPDHPYRDSRGYVREHRLVMEKKLGRYLLPTEVVDHKNRVKDDNRPQNLKLYASNAEHLRATLTGTMPNFSEDGLRRIRENTQRVNLRRSMSIQKAKENGERS